MSRYGPAGGYPDPSGESHHAGQPDDFYPDYRTGRYRPDPGPPPGGGPHQPADPYQQQADPYQPADPYQQAPDPYRQAPDPYRRAPDPYQQPADPWAPRQDTWAGQTRPQMPYQDPRAPHQHPPATQAYPQPGHPPPRHQPGGPGGHGGPGGYGGPEEEPPPRRSAALAAGIVVLVLLVAAGLGGLLFWLTGDDDRDPVGSGDDHLTTAAPDEAGANGGDDGDGGDEGDADDGPQSRIGKGAVVAEADDCLVNDSTDDDPAMRIVACDTDEDTRVYRVLYRADVQVSGETAEEQDSAAHEICGEISGYEYHYRFVGPVEEDSFVLCMREE